MVVHISIRTSDMDRSINFYTRLINLKLLSRRKMPEYNIETAVLQDPEGKGSLLELSFHQKQKRFIQAEYEDRLFDHIAFEVKDIEKTISMMRKENVKIIDKPFKLGPAEPKISFVEDPDGTRIELIERK